MSPHLLLCDEIDSGKSAFCMGLVQRLIEAGARVRGWVTPAHMEEGKKIGHDFVAIEGGRISAPIPFTRPEPFEGSFPWRRFHFNAEAFERADSLLPLCKGESEGGDPKTYLPLPPPYKGGGRCALFIMDEIGPLEITDHKGFYEPMQRLLSSNLPSLVVIRRGLESTLIARFPHIPFRHHSLADKGALESSLFPMTRRGG